MTTPASATITPSFGIPEYWRFDPTGGQRYDAPLAGDRLVSGAYQRVAIHGSIETGLWGRSDALGLDICWEAGKLRWWNPAAQAYLETHDDLAAARIAEREAYLANAKPAWRPRPASVNWKTSLAISTIPDPACESNYSAHTAGGCPT